MIRFQPCYVDGRSDDEYAIDIRDLNSRSFDDVGEYFRSGCKINKKSINSIPMGFLS